MISRGVESTPSSNNNNNFNLPKSGRPAVNNLDLEFLEGIKEESK